MPGRPFGASVRRSGPFAVVDLEGDVNRAAQEGLDSALAEALDRAERVVLNFTEVDYINSTGIALIVGVLAKARTAGVPLAAFGLSDHYREIFTITRLSDFLQLHDGEREALAAN